MNQIKMLLGFGCLLFLIACGGKKSHSDNTSTTAEVTTEQDDTYKEMATDLCTCMRPMADLFKKIKGLTEAGDVDGLTDLMEELETVSEAADDCTDTTYEKHGEPSSESEFEARFRKECPEVAALIAEMNELE